LPFRIAPNPPEAALAPARAAARVAAIAVAAVLVTLLQTAPALAQEPPGNAISGRVVNGTEGGTVPDNFQVILLTVDEELGEVTETNSTHVDRDGSFIFEDVLRSPGITYRVVADYHDVAHATYLDGESELAGVEATIYELTTSPDDLALESYALYVPEIDGQTRTMGMLGVAAVRNKGDRVFVSDAGDAAGAVTGTLWLPAPEGYEDLSVETDLPQGSIIGSAHGWMMTHPVPPGTRGVVFTYTVAYEGDELEFALNLPWGADSLRLFLAEGLGNVRMDGVSADNLVTAGDTTYVMAEGAGYERGSEITVRYERLPTPSFLQSLSSVFSGRIYLVVIIWLAAAGILAMLAYVFFVQRRKQQRPLDDEPGAGPADETPRE